MAAVGWGALATLFLGGEAVQAQAGALRFAFTGGTEFRTREIVSQETITVVMDEEVRSTVSQELTVLRSVDAVAEDGTASVSQTLEALTAHAESPLGIEDYDSRDPNSQPGVLTSGLAPLVGLALTYRVSPRGIVSDVGGVDASLFPDAPGGSAEQLANSFMATLQQSVPQLPEDGLTPGEAWSIEFRMPVPEIGDMITMVRYVYRGESESSGTQALTFDFTVDVTVEVSAGAHTQAVTRVNRGEGTVTMVGGLPVAGESDLDLEMEIEMSEGAEVQRLEQRLIQTQRTERLDAP